MGKNEHVLKQIGDSLKSANRLLVVSHKRPDGDAIGSLLAMGLSLEAAGKEVYMALEGGIPRNYHHLPGSQQVDSRPSGDFDLVIVLDCSDLARVGSVLNGYPQPDVNIDHHPTNLLFARLNLVEAQAVSTTEILARYIPRWGLPLTKEVATALLTGLITDTIGFRTANVNPDTLRVAAHLMEVGADLHQLYKKALVNHSYVASRYRGAGLARLQRMGDIVWTALTLEDRKAVGYPSSDDADLINQLSAIEEAQVAIIFVEQASDAVKVSWRSRPGIDVSRIAMQFGGGGHTVAAGAEIQGDLKTVQQKVLTATQEYLQETREKSGLMIE
jgi:phosphoesterase RecJ-like protein